jgi:glycosyltransferase involved in cell wall biosynthesis
LARAIESVLSQTHPSVEIILIDDGSTDNTNQVASKYPSVKYIFQSNAGVSAARNTGIDHSSGDFILFLDADDWLFPDGLSANYRLLFNNPKIAFVSGAYKAFKAATGKIIDIQEEVNENHFNRFLEFNYIAMIATVLFRRKVLDEFRFDTSLGACEDYDLYLKIARKYPVLHHTEFIATYYFHENNMSYDTVKMMDSAVQVITRQEPHLITEKERKSLRKGVANWKLYYSKVIYAKHLLPGQKNIKNKKKEMQALWINSKSLYFRFFLKKILHVIQSFSKKSYSGVCVTVIA